MGYSCALDGVLQATPMSEEEHLSKKLRLEKRAEGLAMLQWGLDWDCAPALQPRDPENKERLCESLTGFLGYVIKNILT